MFVGSNAPAALRPVPAARRTVAVVLGFMAGAPAHTRGPIFDIFFFVLLFFFSFFTN